MYITPRSPEDEQAYIETQQRCESRVKVNRCQTNDKNALVDWPNRFDDEVLLWPNRSARGFLFNGFPIQRTTPMQFGLVDTGQRPNRRTWDRARAINRTRSATIGLLMTDWLTDVGIVSATDWTLMGLQRLSTGGERYGRWWTKARDEEF